MENFLGKLGRYLKSPVSTHSYVSQEDKVVTAQSSEELPKPEQTIH
jgi:hypothetical protein